MKDSRGAEIQFGVIATPEVKLKLEAIRQDVCAYIANKWLAPKDEQVVAALERNGIEALCNAIRKEELNV